MAFDCIGQKIEVGDMITYPVRSGSTLKMSFSIVTEIEERKTEITEWFYEVLKVEVARTGTQTTVLSLDRVIKLTPEQAEFVFYSNPGRYSLDS